MTEAKGPGILRLDFAGRLTIVQFTELGVRIRSVYRSFTTVTHVLQEIDRHLLESELLSIESSFDSLTGRPQKASTGLPSEQLVELVISTERHFPTISDLWPKVIRLNSPAFLEFPIEWTHSAPFIADAFKIVSRALGAEPKPTPCLANSSTAQLRELKAQIASKLVATIPINRIISKVARERLVTFTKTRLGDSVTFLADMATKYRLVNIGGA